MNCRYVRSTALLVLLLVAGPLHAQDDEPERLRIHGSNLLGATLVPAMVESWLHSNGYVQVRRRELGPARTEIYASRDGERLVVEIDKRGTASGLEALVSGNAELSMSARQPNAEEIEAAWQLGDLRSSAQEWVVGIDGLAVVVAPSNPLASIKLDQLRNILTGKTSNWRQLGGSASPVHVHILKSGSGADELLAQMVLKGARPGASVTRHGSYAQIIDAVSADAAAIGVVGLRSDRGRLKALAIQSGGQSVVPDLASVSTEDYALQRRLYLHTGQLITALGRGFALYALSPAGQAVVARSPFVALNLMPLPPGNADGAPEEYRKIIGGAQRLPVTVRFSSGQDLLDSRGRQDIDRLVEFMARPKNAKARLILLGFANPDPQAPYQSLSLSQERVDYLASELLALRMKVTTVRGFGGKRNLVESDLPLAKYRNNRVEVWLH